MYTQCTDRVVSCLLNHNKQKLQVCENLVSNRPFFIRKDAAESLSPNLQGMYKDSFPVNFTSQPIISRTILN